MKRFFSLFLVVVFLCTQSFLCVAQQADAPAAPPDIKGSAALLAFAETGQVVYEKNPDQKQFPAGLTKLMTALVAFELAGMEQLVTIPENIEQYYGALEPSANLKPGEQIQSGGLIKAILVGSANDASAALALHCCDSIEEFVSKMNEKASQLGMTNTHYVNQSGVHHQEQVTTARDTLTLYRALQAQQPLRQLLESGAVWVEATNLSPRRSFWTNNHLISQRISTKYFYHYAKGGKAASSTAGGSSVAVNAEKGDIPLLCVVMGSSVDEGVDYAFSDAKSLLSYGFTTFTMQTVVKQNELVFRTTAKSASGEGTLLLCTRTPLKALVYKTTEPIQLEQTLHIPDAFYAPIRQGDVMGTVSYSYLGKRVGEVELISANNIKRNMWKHIGNGILWFVTLKPVKVFLIVLFFAVIAYAFLLSSAIKRSRKKKYKKNQYKLPPRRR